MVEESGMKPNDRLEDISILSTQRKRNLASWALPDTILKCYEASGVVSMFPWQVECLSNPRVFEGGNLIYSAPTSAGKTLVAEILTIKTVLERKKKVIIILPFVSVVREKMFYFQEHNAFEVMGTDYSVMWHHIPEELRLVLHCHENVKTHSSKGTDTSFLQDLLSSSGVRVEGLMGSRSIRGGFKGVDIAICTIEKANSLINRLLEEGSLHKVGAVIVDELHLLGDPFRGYLLELLLTKILYMCKKEDCVKIQVVGMSATIPNLALLATWLGADLYQTDFRPVPLKEFLKIGPSVHDNQMKKLYDMQSSKYIQDDPDHVVQLCLETLINGHSVLVFCATKQWCEKLALHIANVFKTIGFSGSNLGQQLREQLDSNAIVEALEQLQRCPVGLDKVLQCTVAFGVAFHHAGLTVDERDILEGCFRLGALRVMVATSTLSSGVNLPARRVIIRSPVFHGKSLDSQTYRQMIGRAGRMGRDTAGESFLICNKAEGPIGEKVVGAELKPIDSCLGHGELAASLKRAILEVIASGVACTPQQVAQYTNCTLLATTKPDLQNPISACVQFLESNELIRLQEEENGVGLTYVPTPLGLACLAASLPPDEGLLLFTELQRARQCFVFDTDLHIIYEVTPYSVCSQWGNLDWVHVLNLWEQLPSAMQRVGELVGIDERFMVRAMRGTLSLSTSKQVQKMSVHRRFYTALALHDLVNEVPLAVVARKFGCSRGMLQSLQQSASTFAGMVTAFCRRLGWSSLELLVSQFQDRLQFGVQRELCDLMRLDGLNGLRARALFDAGISTLADLAAADVCVVENALHKAVPFQSCKELDGETSFDTKQRNKLRNVWITGRQGLAEREAASLLISDARSFLQKELGLADAKWSNQESDVSAYDSQSLSEQSFHITQQQSPLCNKSLKHLEQTVSQSSISCHLQSNLSLVDLQSKISFCETNEGFPKCEKRHSLHHSVSRTKITNLKDGTEKTKTKRLSSKLSDEDYIPSPLLNCSQNKSSQRQTSQMLHSRLSKGKKSKMNSGRISQKTSASRNLGKSKRDVLSKMSVSGTFTANTPYQGVSVFTTQSQCNKLDSTHSRRVTCSSSEESRSKQSLLPETPDNILPLANTVSDKSSNEINQSIDYFSSPLEISESKLHEKTHEFKQNNKARICVEPSSENAGGKVANNTNILNNKEQCLRTFISSHKITDSQLNKNNVQFASVLATDACLSNDNVNQETELLKKDAVNLDDKILNPNISSTLGSLCEELDKKVKIIPTKTDNKRRSSDFFSSPISGGNCARDVESDNQSPSLFGDSLVIDTQLNDMLDECCFEHQATADRSRQNPAQDCNQKSSGDLIIHQESSDMKDHQYLTSVSSSGITASKDEEAVSGKECHKPNEESSAVAACVFSPENLDSAKYDKENIIVGELNLCEAEVCSKMNENISFQKQDHCHTLPKHLVTTHEVMKLKTNKSEILDTVISSPAYRYAGMEGLELPAASDVFRDSIGREGIILHLSSCSSTNKKLSDPHSVYAEELDFYSVADQTAMSPVNSNFKTKKGLVSPVTYNLNEKLQEDLGKCNATLKGSARTKRKISVSSDSSYSENELSNRKRRRVLNRCEISFDEDEMDCAEMVVSVLKENDTAKYWLDTENKSTVESNKNLPPKRQCPDKQQCPKENHGVMEENLHIEKQGVSEQPNPEDDDGITDSFFQRAFDTYWELDTGTIENKKEDEFHHDLGLEKVGISTSKTGPLHELHALIPPSVSSITQKHDWSNAKCDDITSADRCSLNLSSEGTKVGRKIQVSPCIMSNSVLEAAFNTSWEGSPAYKEIKSLVSHGKQNVSDDAKMNVSLKAVDTHSDLRHPELSFENRGSEEHLSSKERKRSACGRRRSPRLLAAAADKENRNSCGKSSETVTEEKDSQSLLQVERQNNEDCSETFSAVSNVYSEVLENKDRYISKKLHTEKNLQDGRLESCVQKQTYDKVDFSQENMDFAASCHVVREPLSTTKTPDIKGLNSSAVTGRPTLCTTMANKILQFSSDSNSDIEAEDDLVRSSQGDEDSERKWGCDKLEKVRWKMSQRDVRNASKSPTHSRQQLMRAARTRSKHVAKKVSPRKPISWGSINIVDVSGHERVWTTFQSELISIPVTSVAIAVACKQFTQPTFSASTSNGGIGARIIGHKNTKPQSTLQDKTLNYGDRSVSGIALCFGGKDVFYISLNQGDQNCVGLQYKLDLIKDLLARKHAVCAFDLKEHVKVLAQCCGVIVDIAVGHDPKVADWLLEPGGKEKNFHAMVLKYCGSSAINLANLVGSSWGVGSPALDLRSPSSARLRACVEAVLTWQLVETQCSSLEQDKLDKIYAEVEMPALLCLARMELNGIGFSRDEAERLRDLLGQQLTALKQHAYKIAGHTFSLTSSADVSKVLYRELGLTASKLSFKHRHPSTSKEALMQIKRDHPLPEIILQWRKLNSIVTKTLYPLLAPGQTSGRLFISSVIHTATGRISMHEPNLQNVPRDFEIVIDKKKPGVSTSVSMRLAFVPGRGKVFVSADYCQLELRILAHLAKDSVLCSNLNSSSDVFCTIAATWNQVAESDVTTEQRQWAKQVCYGMIYGMGAKALGEQLEVEQEDAAVFMDSFKNAYPGVKQFLLDTVMQCRKKGYVETLFGRRRYLATICSSNAAVRAQAERQAINSTVQGSAADIAKKGMILIESRLRNGGYTSFKPVASLALHLHDELLYEVHCEHVQEVAHIIRTALENAVSLSVQLPVKMKVGETWGSLQEITL